ncbi:hypothetical protein CTAYLR_007780 [Chrysophaeum taylorii]|uniref:Acyltransferase n=1 Tax=Chrysophaeum taylorii TaxID=2483200 RepID=A0AAD7XLX6_9STRA|nr:hypothetical protein CTAYLR_007780 [Chrysophaeum taylorii]
MRWWVFAVPSRAISAAQLACAAAFHVVLRQAPEVEATLAALTVGGLFGVAIAWVGIIYGFAPSGRVVVGLGAWYFMGVLLDKRPRTPPRPRELSRFEAMAEAFYAASFRYFPMTLSVAAETKAVMTNKLVFAVHPHGIHCFPLNMFGFRSSPLRREFPELRCVGLAATVIFLLPGIREIFMWMGYVDASRQVARRALDAGNSIYVCTGGERESMVAKPGVDVVVLKARKGFVRLALAAGADIVPVFGFGNADLFPTYGFAQAARDWLQATLSIALPIFHGRFVVTPLPYRKPLHVALGPPVLLPKPPPNAPADWPPPKVVDEAHARYVDAVKLLHKKHAHPGRMLEII